MATETEWKPGARQAYGWPGLVPPTGLPPNGTAMADTQLDQFDELFVISDLHLGDAEFPTLFDASKKFRAWMTNCVLVKCRDQRRVGLVINGDMFDFLAEPGATYFNPQAAKSAVGRIAADNRYQQVFESLQSFLNKKTRRLNWPSLWEIMIWNFATRMFKGLWRPVSD